MSIRYLIFFININKLLNYTLCVCLYFRARTPQIIKSSLGVGGGPVWLWVWHCFVQFSTYGSCLVDRSRHCRCILLCIANKSHCHFNIVQISTFIMETTCMWIYHGRQKTKSVTSLCLLLPSASGCSCLQVNFPVCTYVSYFVVAYI